jgi:hypothetical protein
MNDSRQIEIQLSKAKLTLMFFGCLLFVWIGITFVRNPSKYISLIMRSPTIIFIAGLLSILFFGFISVLLFKNFGINRPE